MIEVEDQFITNIPQGRNSPPTGEPWIYYLFSTAVITWAKYTIRLRDVIVLSGNTKHAVTEALTELITRPGVEWLDPDQQQ